MKDVARFLTAGKYAIAGVSRNPKKFGYTVFAELQKKGMDVVPVNPKTDSINGTKCYPDIAALPGDIKAVILMTPQSETLSVAKEAIAHGIKDIWIQQGAESKQTIEELSREDINLIYKECILMFWKPDSIHSFHRFLKKLFGHLPE